MSDDNKEAKLSSLKTILEKMDKTYGKGSVMMMGERSVEHVEVIPTGSLGLDVALGIGGYPKGRIVEVYGPESSGKTTLTLHAIAEAQKAGRHSGIYRRGTRFRPFLCRKTRCRCRPPGNFPARQRRTGPRNSRKPDTLRRDRHNSHRLGSRPHSQERNRRRNGRLEDGPSGAAHVAGAA